MTSSPNSYQRFRWPAQIFFFSGSLQARWRGPLFYLALDTIIGMLPFHYTGTGHMAAEGFEFFPAREDGVDAVGVRMGPLGRVLNEQLAVLAATLAGQQLDVLIDHVIFDGEVMEPFLTKLDRETTYLVRVGCDIEELERRERARGDRVLGLARFQASRVHSLEPLYDIEVDTTSCGADDLSAELIQFLSGSPQPRLTSTSS